ncbi:hypothetical protein MSG28_002249 [Choristoneura fumiferana]|uniref:Uncharacterized protein n=1 Tax=Choristoneura fumiferana TaxID=7141 RepID=A0ACC0JV14_CHOFU|nr:hypothetical protein MSG28_002249 [Choristoneura fumiferana]
MYYECFAAYPSLFTEDEISSGIPSQANIDTENVDPLMEHNYSRKRHLDHTYCRREPLKDVIASTSSESPRLSEDPVPSTSSGQELCESF